LRAPSLTKKREATTENSFRHAIVTIDFGTLPASQGVSSGKVKKNCQAKNAQKIVKLKR
jgi:hypothetical protein